MCGTTTVVKRDVSHSGKQNLLRTGGQNVSLRETSRPLLTADEVMRIAAIRKVGDRMVPGDTLVFLAGRPTIYGRQILHFRGSGDSPQVAPGCTRQRYVRPADGMRRHWKQATAAGIALLATSIAAAHWQGYRFNTDTSLDRPGMADIPRRGPAARGLCGDLFSRGVRDQASSGRQFPGPGRCPLEALRGNPQVLETDPSRRGRRLPGWTPGASGSMASP